MAASNWSDFSDVNENFGSEVEAKKRKRKKQPHGDSGNPANKEKPASQGQLPERDGTLNIGVEKIMQEDVKFLEAMLETQEAAPQSSEGLKKMLQAHQNMKEMALRAIEKIAYLQGMLDETRAHPPQCKAFADVVRQDSLNNKAETEENVRKEPRPALLITCEADEGTSYPVIKQTLEKHFKPETLGLNDVNTKPIRGGIAVTSNSKEGLEKLQENIKTNKDFRHLKLKISEGKEPELKIVGIEPSVSDHEVPERLVNQNHLSGDAEQIKVIWSTQKKGMKVVTIRISNRAMAKELLLKEKVLLGWSRCSIYPNIFVQRCSWCAKFGHTQNQCTAKSPRCTECGEAHQHSKCIAQVKECPACKMASEEMKDHSMWSFECPQYKRRYSQIKWEMGLGN